MAAVGGAGAGKAEGEVVAVGLESAAAAVAVDVAVAGAAATAEKVARGAMRATVEVGTPPKDLSSPDRVPL